MVQMGNMRRNAAYSGANSLFNICYVRIPEQVFIKKYTKVFVIFNYADSNGIVRESKKSTREEGEVTGGSWGGGGGYKGLPFSTHWGGVSTLTSSAQLD